MEAPLDLRAGVSESSLANNSSLVGKVGDDDVLLVRSGSRFFAVGAHCTHYRGPLADGIVVGDTIRCPLHHACFSLETGEALRAPALDPITCWRVEQRDGKVFVQEKAAPPRSASVGSSQHPSSVVIVGGGAAGLAAADMLRREGYSNPIMMISADGDAPVDRPNLSKDYLAGEAQDDWIPMWPPDLYTERRIELRLGSRVSSIDPAARTVTLENGSRQQFGALLIATGADPVHLPVPGSNQGQILYLRSFADSRAIVERAEIATRVVVIGASFIGLEVAAALRTRGIAVDVVAPESVPLERIMGAEIGRFVQGLHEAHGVVFHLGETAASVKGRDGHVERRRDDRRRFRGDGCWRASVDRARRASRPRARSRHSRQRIPRDLRAQACSPRAMWRDGLIRIPMSVSAWNIGWSLCARVRSRRATCWGDASVSMPCRFSGASTTT